MRHRHRVRRAVGPAVASALIVGVLLLAVFPTRTYLSQRAATSRAREHLAVLTAENEALEERVAMLHSDAEIERLARAEYNLVRPGEDAYAMLPAPPPPTTVPPDDPDAGKNASGGEEGDRSVFERAWDGLTALF